jgi:cytochrome c oxidase assembly protein subunit 15
VAVLFLVLVGGVVRTTGSGMGCPDWPRCFGQWIPPTSVEQLPADYKDKFAAHRAAKNQKFARYLQIVGLNETANRITHDPEILEEADFNATKTWIEYLNRVVGVIIGLLIIAVFIASWKFRQAKPSVFRAAGATLLLVILQGWFGSIVVSTNLTTWTISLHMFLALVIVCLLTWLLHTARPINNLTAPSSYIRPLVLVCIVLFFVQVFLGTEVRSAIDRVAARMPRSEWINALGFEFVIHRSFSWLVLAANGFLAWKMLKTNPGNRLVVGIIVLILGSFFSGVGMAYAGMPAVLQPLHLVIASITIALQFLIWLRLNPARG